MSGASDFENQIALFVLQWLLLNKLYRYIQYGYMKRAFCGSIQNRMAFFQNEVLGMSWLKRLIATILNVCGLDITSLLVFLYSAVYRVYKRRLAAWRYILLFDFFADG